MSHFIYPIINFLILFLGLGYILTRAFGTYFKKQRDELDQKMRSASQEYESMKKEFEETRALMNSLESRISEMQFNASREAQLEAKKIEFEAERFVEKLVADGELKIRAEVSAMKNNLEKDLMNQAMASARQVLTKELNTKDAAWTGAMLEHDSAATEGRKNYAS